jgi:hypothetical protein
MDTNINIAPKEIAPGIFSTGGVATIPTNVITPQSLAPQPQINVNTPQELQTPAPTVEGDMAFFNQLQNQQTQEQQRLQEQQSQKNTGVESLMRDLGLQGQEQLSQEQQFVNPLQSQITDLTGQLGVDLADYQKAAQQYEKLKTDLEVGVRGSGNADIRASMLFGQQGAVDRAKAAELNVKASDIAIKQANILALQGKADLAQKQVDRAIDLKYKAKENELKIQMYQLDQIKDNLNASEKKQAEARNFALQREEKRIAEQKQNEKDIQNLAIKLAENGADSATISKVQQAKNMNEAINLGSKFIRNPKDSLDMELTKAQIANTWANARKVDTVSGNLSETQLKQIDTSPQGKKLVSLSGLYQKSQTYKNLLDTYGFQAIGSEKAKLDQAYADLKIAYKEAANLGALTGPDVTLLEEAIKPASGARNYLNYKLSGGKKGVSGAIEGALSKARAEALQNFKQLTARKPEYRGSEYVTSLITPFATDYSKADIDNMGAGEIIQTEDGILLESLGNGQFTPL